MKAYLDGQACPLDESADLTVGLVLEKVLKDVHADGRVIASISCDGTEVDADTLSAVLAERAGRYERLDFESDRPGKLAIEALSHVQALLMDLESGKEQAVENLNQGHTAEAMELLRTYFEIWHQAHHAVHQSIKLVQLDIAPMTVDGVAVPELFGQFAEQLRDLKETLEARDHVALADIMSYEAEQTTQRWIALIEQLKTACQGQ
jgi:hypothetical protein